MAPTPSILMSSRSKKKEPRYLCLSEAKASHSPKICTEVSSSVPHFLQVWLLLSPITCRCLLKVLCLVSTPITTLDCVLLKDNNRAPVARLGSEINSRACLCVPHGLRHNARCCLCTQSFIFLLIFWLTLKLRCPQFFPPKPRSHVQIQAARRATLSKFHTKDPQFGRDV